MRQAERINFDIQQINCDLLTVIHGAVVSNLVHLGNFNLSEGDRAWVSQVELSDLLGLFGKQSEPMFTLAHSLNSSSATSESQSVMADLRQHYVTTVRFVADVASTTEAATLFGITRPDVLMLQQMSIRDLLQFAKNYRIQFKPRVPLSLRQESEEGWRMALKLAC